MALVGKGAVGVGRRKKREEDERKTARSVRREQAERKKAYDAFQKILHDDQPYMFLYTPYSLPILTARIQGVVPAPAGISYNFTKWWIPRDKQTFRLP